MSYYYNLLQPRYLFLFTLLLVKTCILISLLISWWMYESFCPSLTLASTSSLQLPLLKSIKTVLSLKLTLTYPQRVPRSNKYVRVEKEFYRLLLMHAASGSSPSPQHSLFVHPFFLMHPLSTALSVHPSLLSHSSTRLASRPVQVTSYCMLHAPQECTISTQTMTSKQFIHQMAAFQQTIFSTFI